MNVEELVSDNFRKEAKKYLKKFPSLKNELVELSDSLLLNPKQGVKLTETTFKIRIASKSKGKGKSGGFRVITYLVETIEGEDETVVVTLLSIYDKSEISTLKDNDISLLVAEFLTQKANKERENNNLCNLDATL